MENRILIIGDELFGSQGEAASRCVEMLLCRKPNRPMQFSVNAPVLLSISQLLSRASSDIIGKQAGTIILGLGFTEMKRESCDACKVVSSYSNLVEEVIKKTQSQVFLLTIPRGLLPDLNDQMHILNDSIRGFVHFAPERIKIMDFDVHAENFKELQAEKGKFARSLYSESLKPTSLCLTLLSLFIEDCILETMN